MAKIKTKPNPGDVVVLTFVGYAKGALGVWSGTSWFMWRYTNAGATGEPNNWHVVEDNLIRAWAEIPAGVLATLGVPPTPVEQRAAPLRVVDTTEPWRPAMESYPAGRKYLRLVARAHAKLKRDASAACMSVSPRGLGRIGNSTVRSRAKKAVAALVASQRTRMGRTVVESTGSVLDH